MMMNAKMRDCLTACSECRTMCLQTVQMCLEKGGKLADAKMNTLLAECAQLCQMTEACAKHCDDCSRACDALNPSALRECAAALRQCAAACRALKFVPKSAVSA
jgi:hypothetical protein